MSRAIRKYGKESFNRTILEECPIEQLNEREKYYIAKYNTISPNGYNLTAGGDSNAHLKTTPQKILDIKEDLRNSLLTQAEIAKKYNLHWRSISDINVGKM